MTTAGQCSEKNTQGEEPVLYGLNTDALVSMSGTRRQCRLTNMPTVGRTLEENTQAVKTAL